MFPRSSMSTGSAFPAALLPTVNLPAGYHMRPLASDDYHKGHLQLMAVLTVAPDVGEAAWVQQFGEMLAATNVYYCMLEASPWLVHAFKLRLGYFAQVLSLWTTRHGKL